MCGIVGYVGDPSAVEHVVEGLKRLEYRGYDSAGVATVSQGELLLRRKKGKLRELSKLLSTDPIQGELAIGHTRWATHGRPSDENASSCRRRFSVGSQWDYRELSRTSTRARR